MNRIDDPLVATPPDEVPLANAPLVRVIAQLKFPPVLSVEQREFVAPFQEALRRDYPILRQERVQTTFVGPEGVSASAAGPVVWRFSDAIGDWRLSLSIDFVSLETTRYVSRTDFLDRLRTLLEALRDQVKPEVVDRLGIRYIDRINGAELAEIGELVRPELLGVLGTSMSSRVEHTLTESTFLLPDMHLQARWGVLPAHASIDPSAIEPISEPSWILDLDLFTTSRRPFDVDAVIAESHGFAERAYTLFRWAVTDDFLRRYGGNPP